VWETVNPSPENNNNNNNNRRCLGSFPFFYFSIRKIPSAIARAHPYHTIPHENETDGNTAHAGTHRPQHFLVLLLAATVSFQAAAVRSCSSHTYLLVRPSAGPCCCCSCSCCAPSSSSRPLLPSTTPSCESSNRRTWGLARSARPAHSPWVQVQRNGRQLFFISQITRRDETTMMSWEIPFSRLGMRTRDWNRSRTNKEEELVAASERTCGGNAGRLSGEEEERASPRSAAEESFVAGCK
jgi:hypothetical protein